MTPLKNDLLIRALLRQPVPRTPVWIMRQAGRYLPEYRAVREKAGDFMSLCSNPELACEVTLQPLRRFDLDAAIIFSDILTIPDAMGLGLHFVTGEGPQFERPVSTAADITKLAVPDIAEKLGYVFDAVALTHRELDGKVPLIGFSGSPWTVATYMVEGRSSREFAKIKGLMTDDPSSMEALLDVVAKTTIEYPDQEILRSPPERGAPTGRWTHLSPTLHTRIIASDGNSRKRKPRTAVSFNETATELFIARRSAALFTRPRFSSITRATFIERD